MSMMTEQAVQQPLLTGEIPEEDTHGEYQLLVGHNRTDGSHKSDEQLRMEYVHLTDELIRKMTDGVPVQDPETGESHFKRPDFVVWLDKSARPVAWLTKELWPQLAADKDGDVPNLPAFRFVNIDREQWVNQIDPNGTGYMDIDAVDPSIIRSLRSLFVDPETKKHGLTPDIDAAPTQLDDKVVLIVDEVFASGRTLDIATKFFKRAFPEANVASTHWMRGVATRERGLSMGNADLPVWYKESDNKGRGVDNRNERTSQRSMSQTQRLGAWFLSTRSSEPDSDSRQLRQELNWLAQDVRDHELLVFPSTFREDDDFVERAERLNGGIGFDEFIKLRAEHSLR